jgi:hypothetical protein
VKNDKGSSTFRFFLDWLGEKLYENAKKVVVLFFLGAAATFASIYIGAHTKVPMQGDLGTDEETQTVSRRVGSERNLASVPTSVTGQRPTQNNRATGSSRSNSVDEPIQRADSAPPISYQGTSQPSSWGGSAQGRSNFAGSASGSEGVGSNSDSKSKGASTKDSDTPANNQTTSVFGTPVPLAGQTNSGTSGGTFTSGSGSIPVSAFGTAAGFQFVAGGGSCTGTGMQATVTIGSVTSGAIQNGTGVMLINGLEGILFQ